MCLGPKSSHGDKGDKAPGFKQITAKHRRSRNRCQNVRYTAGKRTRPILEKRKSQKKKSHSQLLVGSKFQVALSKSSQNQPNTDCFLAHGASHRSRPVADSRLTARVINSCDGRLRACGRDTQNEPLPAGDEGRITALLGNKGCGGR